MVNVNPDIVLELTVLLLVGFVMGPSSVVLRISTVVEVLAVPPLAFKVMVYLTGITQRTEAPINLPMVVFPGLMDVAVIIIRYALLLLLAVDVQ